MIWRDHVFNYGPKIGDKRDKILRKKLARHYPGKLFSRNFVILGAFWKMLGNFGFFLENYEF